MPEWLMWTMLIAFGLLMFALAFIINEVAFTDREKEAMNDTQDRTDRLTQEQINDKLFEFVFEVSLIEGLRKDSVHKIREIFHDDRTTIWFLVSGDTTVEVKGNSTTEFDVGDEVIVVTYHKKTGELCGAAFEWSSALLSPRGMLF